MKLYFLIAVFFTTVAVSAQSSAEKDVLKISSAVFELEVKGDIDSLQNILHEKFIAAGSDGSMRSKSAYLDRLKNGGFVHDSINVEECTATVTGNTAVVAGKGRFAVTVSGKKTSLHLSYMEVFARENKNAGWKLLAIKAAAMEK